MPGGQPRGTTFMTCEQRDAAASSPEHVAAVPVPSISRQSSVHLTAKKHTTIPRAWCAALVTTLCIPGWNEMRPLPTPKHGT